MSIISIKEDWKGETYQVSVDDNRSRTDAPILIGEYTRTFDIDFNTSPDTWYNKSWFAQRAYDFFRNPDGSTLPRPYEVLPCDPWCYVDRYAVQGTGPLSRRVTVVYKSFVDPMTMPIEKRLYFRQSSDILDYAPIQISREVDFRKLNDLWELGSAHQKALVNASGEPLDPAVIKEYNDLVMQFRFWRQYDFATMAAFKTTYMDAVNFGVFLGFPMGTVKCTSIQADEKQVGPNRYWDVSMEFTVRYKPGSTFSSGWFRRFLNQGFRILTYDEDGEITGFTQIVDDNDKPISKPAKLTALGLELSEGGEPWFIYVRDFEFVTFAPLNLE